MYIYIPYQHERFQFTSWQFANWKRTCQMSYSNEHYYVLNVQVCNGGDCLFVCCYEMYRSKLKIMWNKHNSKCERCRRWCAWFYKWVSSEKGVSIIHMQVWNYFLQIYCQFHHVVLIWKANQNFVGYIDFKVKGNMDENKFATEQVQLYSFTNGQWDWQCSLQKNMWRFPPTGRACKRAHVHFARRPELTWNCGGSSPGAAVTPRINLRYIEQGINSQSYSLWR